MTALPSYMLKNVPRYTSYPTAPHFSAFPNSLYANWLQQSDPNKPISLYLHVPFCKQLCWYCGCNMKLASKYGPLKSYVKTLMREIELVVKHLPQKMQVAHLHWGGGTPTALEAGDIADVMALLRERFDILPDCEIAIESDPRTLSQEMITRLGELGFNRASFGVQEFNADVQKAINRIQPEKMVRECVKNFRSAGVKNINFDLIYGLPHQTLEMIKKTVEISADIKPDRIALFGYAHVPWMAKKQRLIDSKALPGAEARFVMAKEAARLFEEAGYQAIGFDHFALSDDDLALAANQGELHRNFQGFTNDNAETLIGMGASSIGKTAFGYVQNFTETGAWARAVEAGEFPIVRGHVLSLDDKMRGGLIEALICQGRVDLADGLKRNGYDQPWQELFEIDDFIEDGMVEIEGDQLIVLEKGKKLVRVIASRFDAYIGACVDGSKTRHSIAV